MRKSITETQTHIIQCKRCPRLREYCQKIGKTKKKAFLNDSYWAKPVPGFGQAQAEICIIGLAPAAHGANRTGRMFTGDRSGLWLYRALHKAELCNQAHSENINDGLRLINTYITSVVHCAPPDNKPTPEEKKNCITHLEEEISLLKNVKVYIVLGQIAFNGLWSTLQLNEKKPKFSHGLIFKSQTGITIIASYHPSQQNTFTKRLTEPMFDHIFESANQIINNK